MDNFTSKETVQQWGKIVSKLEILRETVNSDPDDARRNMAPDPIPQPQKAPELLTELAVSSFHTFLRSGAPFLRESQWMPQSTFGLYNEIVAL